MTTPLFLSQDTSDRNLFAASMTVVELGLPIAAPSLSATDAALLTLVCRILDEYPYLPDAFWQQACVDWLGALDDFRVCPDCLVVHRHLPCSC